jgi:flavin-dependent dehydrogenase
LTHLHDVLVLGGGPAGLATSIALAQLGRTVVVVEKSCYDRPRVGETFGPELKPHLEALGVWDEFAALNPLPFQGVVSAWGSPVLLERSSIFSPLGAGWHVNRVGFDQMLAGRAAQVGVTVKQVLTANVLGWSESRWHAQIATEKIRARYLVDASGRGAPATARCISERRWLRMDRQIAVLGLLSKVDRPVEPVLLLEAVAEGWWYSVPQPGGNLLTVFITDADLCSTRGKASIQEYFLAQHKKAVHTAARANQATPCDRPWIARSDTGLLAPDRGSNWRAVGDAAMACDPLAGDGVVRAIQSGLEAARAIHRELDGEANHEVLQDPDVSQRFLDYLVVRARYYLVEGRWPESPFWVRRRPVNWATAPIFLNPQACISWDGAMAATDSIAAAEALIGPGAIRELRLLLATAHPAHEALALLRAASPGSDRQLLVGLQLLVSSGWISVVG